MAAAAPDIVFAFPPASGNYGSFTSHLGVSYLRAALARRAIATRQYLNSKPGTLREIARELIEFHSPLIGFTTYDANAPLCIAIARAVKAQQPEKTIVFGGPSVTFNSRELMSRNDVIDLCVLGEAEETGPLVIERLLRGHAPEENWPGIAFRRDGEVVCTRISPLVGVGGVDVQSSLDITPSPYLSGMLPDGRAGVLTGRGCTHDCQYCCFAALGQKRLRLHSTDRVLAELEFISDQQRRTGRYYAVGVQDDAFTLLPRRAKEICEAIIGRKLKLVLSCVTRADTVDDELLELMRRAGFRSIAFGLESAVPSVLRATGKVRPPNWPDPDLSPEREFVERVRKSVTSASRMGFQVGVSIVLGLPSETPQDARATMRFVKALPVNYYMHNLLSVLPGTPLWMTHERYEINCEVGQLGVAETTRWAYEVTDIAPVRKCDMEAQAELLRGLVADEMFECTAHGSSRNGVATAVLDTHELSGETAAWLGRILTIGGTVVQIYGAVDEDEVAEQMARDRATMTEYLVPARFYVQLESRRRRDGTQRYWMNAQTVDLLRRHKPRTVSFVSSTRWAPMQRWLQQRNPGCDVCELTPQALRSPELVRLKQGIRANPARLGETAPPPRFQYAGRWLKDGEPCGGLSRLEVNNSGEVRTCRFGVPIGKVGNSKTELRNTLIQEIRVAEKRRGCRYCNVAECPRCPFPGIHDAAYCSSIRGRAPVVDTLHRIRIYSRLLSTVVREQDRNA